MIGADRRAVLDSRLAVLRENRGLARPGAAGKPSTPDGTDADGTGRMAVAALDDINLGPVPLIRIGH